MFYSIEQLNDMPEEGKEEYMKFQRKQTTDVLETYLMRTILPYYKLVNASDEEIYKDFTESKVNTIKYGLFDDYALVEEIFDRTVKKFRRQY